MSKTYTVEFTADELAMIEPLVQHEANYYEESDDELDAQQFAVCVQPLWFLHRRLPSQDRPASPALYDAQRDSSTRVSQMVKAVFHEVAQLDDEQRATL